MTITREDISTLEARSLKAKEMCVSILSQEGVGLRTREFLNQVFVRLREAPPHGATQVDVPGLKTLVLLADCCYRDIELYLARELLKLQEEKKDDVKSHLSP